MIRSRLIPVQVNKTCASDPANSASLITILRSAAIGSATAGAYSGTLTLILAPV